MGVEVGDGLVARFGDALVLVAEVAEHRERAEELLAAVEGAASGPVPSGTLIATRLATIVANGQPGTVPSFGVVAPLGDGYLVLLHGTVSAEITGAPGVLRLSGEQAVTWVDQRIEVPVDRLSVTCREHPVKVDPMSDLRAGLVPGSGFVLTPGGPAGTRNAEVVDSEQAGTHTTQTSEGPAAWVSRHPPLRVRSATLSQPRRLRPRPIQLGQVRQRTNQLVPRQERRRGRPRSRPHRLHP